MLSKLGILNPNVGCVTNWFPFVLVIFCVGDGKDACKDGGNVGIINHLSITTQVSFNVSEDGIIDALEDNGMIKIENMIHNELNNEINMLEKKKQALIEETKKDKELIDKLKNIDSLEHFAREKYNLKKENEEIFIIEYEENE